jgi:hypothetical protein
LFDVLIFPIFSALIWSLAMVWRRRWPSFVVVTSALAFLLSMMHLLAAWHEHLPPMSHLLYELLWPYILLTGTVGYYICCLPRRPAGPLNCRKCGYHLEGLNPVNLKCPECGRPWRGQGSGFEQKPVALLPIPTRPIPRRTDLPPAAPTSRRFSPSPAARSPR